jgi:hypothetical protein
LLELLKTRYYKNLTILLFKQEIMHLVETKKQGGDPKKRQTMYRQYL